MTRMRQGPGAPSFCWVCNRQLQRAPGRGLGLFYFELVRDPAGIEHRVHGFPCLKMAVEDGNKRVKDSEARTKARAAIKAVEEQK